VTLLPEKIRDRGFKNGHGGCALLKLQSFRNYDEKRSSNSLKNQLLSTRVLVDIRELHKNFGKLEVLKGINMHIHESGVVRLIRFSTTLLTQEHESS